MEYKEYEVTKKITITYTHKVGAYTKKEAEEYAVDLGEENASDGTTDTGWKAKEIKEYFVG